MKLNKYYDKIQAIEACKSELEYAMSEIEEYTE